MSLYREENKIDLARMRRERVEKARAQMEKEGIGAYLCFDPGNLTYLTDTYSNRISPMFARNALFPRTGDPILYEWGFRWQRVRDELAPWLKGNVKPGWRLRFYLTRGLKPTEFLNDLKKVLNEHGVINEPLAVDMSIVTGDFFQMLRDEGLKVIDAFPSLNRAMAIKTQDEIQCLRMSFTICDEIFYEIQKAIRPGIRESDLAAIAMGMSVKRFCDGPNPVVSCSGENTNPNMLHYSDRTIRPGEMIFVDLPGVRYKGYGSCIYRTFTCGRATQRQKEIYEECRDLLYKGFSQVRAGNTTADICKAWPGPEHWGGKTWRDTSDCAVGHGLGLGTQEIPIITPMFSVENPITLEEGMVIALETFYGSKPDEYPKQGARIESGVVVGKTGYEDLSRWPDDKITECWI